MTSSTAPPRVLAAASLASFLNLATLLIFPFGVFALAISADTGWPRQAITATLGPALLITIVAQPVNGWLIQRFYKPAVAVASMVGVALGLTFMALSPPNLGLFGATLALAIGLAVVATPGIVSAIISEAFDRRRGLALGIAMACTGLGVAVLPILCQTLIQAFGWRAAYGVLAAIVACAAAGVALLLGGVKGPVRERSTSGAGDLRAAVRRPTFWVIGFIFFALSVVANAVPLHLPLILHDRGADAQTSALSLSIIGIMMICGRPLAGYLIDRLPIRATLAILLAGPLAGCIGLLLSASQISALIASAGFGLAVGGEFVCLGYMVSRAFGMRSFGTIYGWLSLGLATGVALGPIAISALLTLGRGYAPALLMMLVVTTIAFLLTLTLDDRIFRPSALEIAKKEN